MDEQDLRPLAVADNRNPGHSHDGREASGGAAEGRASWGVSYAGVPGRGGRRGGVMQRTVSALTMGYRRGCCIA